MYSTHEVLGDGFMGDMPRSSSPDMASSSRGVQDDNGSDNDDDVFPIRPQGGLAGKLMRQARPEETESEGEVDGKNAYQLMKQRLLFKKKPREESPLKVSNQNTEDTRQPRASKASPFPKSTPPNRSARSPSPVHTRESSPSITRTSLSPEHNPVRDATPDESAEELPDVSHIQSRLQELVAQKRAERLAKEEEEKQHRQATDEEELDSQPRPSKSSLRHPKIISTAETDSDDEGASARKLTQQARPTRKASKKALEEMNRETQRISRNQQLAHSMQTKKKIRKEDLFARFNFRTSTTNPKAEQPQTRNATDMNVYTINSASASSEAEVGKDAETPPSSPQTAEKQPTQQKPEASVTEERPDYSHLIAEDSDEDLPTPEESLARSKQKPDKGKAPIRGDYVPSPNSNFEQKPAQKTTKTFRVIPPSVKKGPLQQSESDDDFEIVDKRFAVFDKMPARKAKEPHAMLTLRALAKLTSPGKQRKKGKASMNAHELQSLLSKRARDQARKERDEKIEELKAKGIYIQTEEEKQKDQLEFENLLEAARKREAELSKKEKEEAGDEGDGLPSSDEEYEDEGSHGDEEEVNEDPIELSGSEEEADDEAEIDDEDVDGEEEDVAQGNSLVDNEAQDSGTEDEAESEAQDDEARDPEDGTAPEPKTRKTPAPIHMRSRRSRVIDDEDDDEDDDEMEPVDAPVSTDASQVVPDLGFVAPVGAPLSLSQMFAATMDADASQTQDDEALLDVNEDSMAFMRQLPPTAPDFDAIAEATQLDVVQNSQVETPRRQVQKSQSSRPGLTPGTARTDKYAGTVASDFPDPTQDGGFEFSRLPNRGNLPHSTIETIPLHPIRSPSAKPWGRLRRRAETDANAEFSDPDEEDPAGARLLAEEDEFEISANAFDVMKTAAKKPNPAYVFDKKKSEAKAMVEEQAEESEDEYAGLGGASDDESGGEADEEIKKLIDEGDVKLNERELAAFYADKERIRDEKQVEKLYRDIANGGLRKKRGADFELSDSDDDAEQRRRRKQRDFARQRKALLEDENIGKIAENPRKAAFLRAIEDRDPDDDIDMDFFGDDAAVVPDSQSTQSASAGGPETQVPSSNPLKRKYTGDEAESQGRLPAQLRRTNPSKKPSNLIEIRETLSFLIDDNRDSIPETPISESEPERDDGADENETPHHDADAELYGDGDGDSSVQPSVPQPVFKKPLESRRSSANPIIDRLSLKRNSTTSSLEDPNTATSENQTLAFFAPTKSTPGFKVPSLLRRATTNTSLTSTSSTGTEVASSRSKVADEVAGVRRGGSKKSSINYAAREAERRSIVEEREKKRADGVKRAAVGRRGVLRGLGVGSGFE